MRNETIKGTDVKAGQVILSARRWYEVLSVGTYANNGLYAKVRNSAEEVGEIIIYGRDDYPTRPALPKRTPRTSGPVRYVLDPVAEFFYWQAGYSYASAAGEPEDSGRVRCALDLAYAERRLKASDAWVEWSADDDAATTASEGYDGPTWVATLYRAGADDRDAPEVLASLGGIECDSDSGDYARVIEAQLSDEAGL